MKINLLLVSQREGSRLRFDFAVRGVQILWEEGSSAATSQAVQLPSLAIYRVDF